MEANKKGIVVREIELATYLVCQRIGGEVEVEFEGAENTPFFIFADVARANELIAQYRANGLKELLTRYYSGVKELELAVELAAVAKGIE